ncbi:YbaB/EbfC family nucleoid-associated protein [Mycoplasmopsis columbinasalis]|uniref:UPF0133 protein MALL_0399 n=1 Tax=Mycoplasmopsis columbinasalis TaxID=114880 RepID=A0A449BBI9_9BACT|nr:YbaB/EbfC family nucleoid-associated protein [Mycoplasmopsis columbinasalis]VEU78413.1 UPF0133 protein MALL_0399 [Mycoplasmopsis columbinasalis]
MDAQQLRKAKKLQQETMAKQETFEKQEFSLEKHGIEIKANGARKILALKIKDSVLFDPEDPETLEDLLILTLNELFENISDEEDKLLPNIPGF